MDECRPSERTGWARVLSTLLSGISGVRASPQKPQNLLYLQTDRAGGRKGTPRTPAVNTGPHVAPWLPTHCAKPKKGLRVGFCLNQERGQSHLVRQMCTLVPRTVLTVVSGQSAACGLPEGNRDPTTLFPCPDTRTRACGRPPPSSRRAGSRQRSSAAPPPWAGGAGEQQPGLSWCGTECGNPLPLHFEGHVVPWHRQGGTWQGHNHQVRVYTEPRLQLSPCPPRVTQCAPPTGAPWAPPRWQPPTYSLLSAVTHGEYL